ncbi:hypothetical protein DL98DRAFT_434956 [Cadophora sp. DSE1049]|nr:hypothetical protein DL98DRAFT_434956 [Cadophora sp. DSE1049]
MPIVPARKSVAFRLQQGQHLQISNSNGKQIVDFWAFNPSNHDDFLSIAHTRTGLSKLSLAKGDPLYSSKRKPMLSLIEDTTGGVHDLLWPACDAERYRTQGYEGHHDNCSDNLRDALDRSFPDFRADRWVSDPLNLFMDVRIASNGQLDFQVPSGGQSQYVVLRAEVNLNIVMSACPQDMVKIEGWEKPTDCRY